MAATVPGEDAAGALLELLPTDDRRRPTLWRVVEPDTPTELLDDEGFRALVDLIADRFAAIGPQVRDSSVVLDTISSSSDLAAGVTLEQAPGKCRVTPLPEGDRRRFAWAVGTDSAKATRHPAEKVLFTAIDTDGAFRVEPEPEAPGGKPLALIGLRSCDVAAAGTLHNVLGSGGGEQAGPFGPGRPFVVVVNCTDPGGTCFCASMGTGPALAGNGTEQVDIVLWERNAAESGGQGGLGGTPEYLITHTSARGAEMLSAIDTRPAGAADHRWAAGAMQESVRRMGRTLVTERLPERLTMTLDSQRWDDIALRCLSCGNCTMVCPTCFCSSVQDSSDLAGSTVSRTQRWDSCFTLDHSYIHGGSVRSSTRDRYRQWMTHKLSSWWGQFGESGCVGCGRCISWCPVGIDLVEEANVLSAEAVLAPGGPEDAGAGGPDSRATQVLLRRREVAVR
jgi:sulfhydrogenase subunit beta (sulfur reductase)